MLLIVLDYYHSLICRYAIDKSPETAYCSRTSEDYCPYHDDLISPIRKVLN